MRILITTGIFPPDIGGPATYVPHIAKFLAEQGHFVRVVTAADETNPRDSDSALTYTVLRYSRKAPLFRRLWNSLSLVAEEMRTCDVVLANGLYGLVALAKLFSPRPVLMKIVGDPAWERSVGRGYTSQTIDDFQKRPGSLRARVLAVLRRLVVSRASLVVTPSAYLGKIVQGWGVSDTRIKIIRNAIKVPEAAPQHRIPSRIVTICRLVPWKGVQELVSAVGTLPGVSLDIIGEGPLESVLRNHIRDLSLEQRVRLRGALPREEVLQELSQASACVLNSEYEGLPHVLLESILLGTPVVARNVGGTSEVVTHGGTGFLVETRDAGALASAISAVLTPGALPNFDQARAKVQALYSLFEMETQTAEALVSLNPRLPNSP
jgi:glycosyltransferase involved in cell wall biosynthesis